jgi:prophage regulatory protein
MYTRQGEIMTPRGRILRLKEVTERVGLKKSSIYRFMSIGTFPKNFKIGQRASGWMEEDINKWVEKRITG